MSVKNQKMPTTFGYIDPETVVEEGAKVLAGAYVLGNSVIGAGTVIYPNSVIENSVVGKNVVIKSSYIEDSVVEDNVEIGPFAHLRPNAHVCTNAKVGNFVEIKNATLGRGSKASHLAYVGDADVGENCNIGCGAIFVNYNGKTKNRTTVGNNCFIGSNCNIVAPVTIADNSYICAGTTLTVDTENADFVIGRCRETIKKQRAKQYLKEIV